MDRQNLTLLTDLYELTMMQGYFKHKDRNETVIFDAFYRNNPCDGGYAIAAGLEQLIKYIKELHFSAEDIDYLAGLGIFEKDFLGVFAAFKSVSLVVKLVCLMHSVHQVASVQSILVATFHSNDRTESE